MTRKKHRTLCAFHFQSYNNEENPIYVLRNIQIYSKCIEYIIIHLYERFGNCYMDKNEWQRIKIEIT